MPTYVVKCEPDRDLYVLWSSVVDNMVGVGTREEILTELTMFGTALPEAQLRLERADANGSSALWPMPLGPDVYLGWDNQSFIVGNVRTLDCAQALLWRHDLAEYATIPTAEVEQLLRPLVYNEETEQYETVTT